MLKYWLLAARPKTLTGAAAPVLLGGALAYNYSGTVEGFWIPFCLCLLFAFLMQIDANFVNDYWDFRKGTDREDRLGPERACAQGWIKPEAMAWGIGVTTLLSCMVGVAILAWNWQWELVAVGVACVLGCFLYTLKLSYLGWGDVLVLMFFGVVPVGFTFYVITGGEWSLPVTLAGLGMGLATDCLLIVNNYRDREQDRLSGKRTIIVRFGGNVGIWAYLLLGIAAALLMDFALREAGRTSMFAVVIYCVAHVMSFMKMRNLDGRELNGILGETARNIFLYGVLFALGLIL